MRSLRHVSLAIAGLFGALWLLHYPVLNLPYFWDEAGYYIPAALDFYREGLLIPKSALPVGHTPVIPIYLALAWRAFGFSPLVTRTAMIVIASATVVSLYAVARQAVSREVAAWSALLLAACPLFFAQSSLAHPDLAAALFTTLAILALARDSGATFALAASFAVLSKETAVVLLPVAWLFVSVRAAARRAPLGRTTWIWLLLPLLSFIGWGLYYHHATGYWTGNREYLEYNLYSTLTLRRFLHTLPRRIEKVFVAGFNWLLVAGAVWGYLWRKKRRRTTLEQRSSDRGRFAELLFSAGGLCLVYVLMLSVVGGAVLNRYLLPVFPLFFLAAVVFVWQLPRARARMICFAVVICFVGSWFINPPWPFPFDDNLSYTDFIRLHQEAAWYLENQAGNPRILTAWPTTDELARPFLGYVQKPLRVVPLPGFSSDDLASVPQESFDILCFYSRKWEPKKNWTTGSRLFQAFRNRFLDITPQVPEGFLIDRYGLRLVKDFERRGQWVRIYSRKTVSCR